MFMCVCVYGFELYIYIFFFFSSCVHFASMRCIVVKEVASFPGARSINGRGA